MNYKLNTKITTQKMLKLIQKMPKMALIGGVIGLITVLFFAPMLTNSMTIYEYLDLVSYRLSNWLHLELLFTTLSRLCRFGS